MAKKVTLKVNCGDGVRCNACEVLSCLIPDYEPLTPRECEVFQAALLGWDSSITAQRLGVSLRTIETHRSNIARKCNQPNLGELFRIIAAASVCLPLGES